MAMHAFECSAEQCGVKILKTIMQTMDESLMMLLLLIVMCNNRACHTVDSTPTSKKALRSAILETYKSRQGHQCSTQ